MYRYGKKPWPGVFPLATFYRNNRYPVKVVKRPIYHLWVNYFQLNTLIVFVRTLRMQAPSFYPNAPTHFDICSRKAVHASSRQLFVRQRKSWWSYLAQIILSTFQYRIIYHLEAAKFVHPGSFRHLSSPWTKRNTPLPNLAMLYLIVCLLVQLYSSDGFWWGSAVPKPERYQTSRSAELFSPVGLINHHSSR